MGLWCIVVAPRQGDQNSRDSAVNAGPARRPKAKAAVRPKMKSNDGARTAHEQAYEALRGMVLAGGFQPGDVLTLRSLASQLGLGAMPVREALRRLTSEGAFEALPNRSARVPALNRRQVEQILELRAHLEGKAAAQAARHITLVQIEQLRAMQDGIERNIDEGNSRALTALNMAFHFE